MYNIMCYVSGGNTGSGSALLKNASGKVAEFSTKEAALAEADHLNSTMNTGYGPASFSYDVIEKETERRIEMPEDVLETLCQAWYHVAYNMGRLESIRELAHDAAGQKLVRATHDLMDTAFHEMVRSLRAKERA